MKNNSGSLRMLISVFSLRTMTYSIGSARPLIDPYSMNSAQ